MKKKRFVISIAVITILCSLLTVQATQLDTIPSSESQVYEYPYIPGTQAWIDLDSYMNRLEACQIPNDILLSMTTPDLLETVLNYPFLVDVMAFNTYQAGFDNMRYKFNGLNELMSRPDMIETVIDAYQTASIDPYTYSTPSAGIKELTFLEIVLAQDEVIGSLNDEELSALNSIIDEKLSEKLDYPEVYGILSLYTPFIVDGTFEASPFVLTPTEELCNKKWIYTSCNTRVEAWIVNELLNQNEINNQVEALLAHPSAKQISPPTLRFNCHSYAFWDASVTNQYWINNPINFLACYNTTASPATNDRIYFNSASHSGIVTSTNPKKITSKWGSGCLVSSDYDDTPYYNNERDITYYTSK